MAGYHQIAIVVDVTPEATNKKEYRERVEKVLSSLNRPETAKANVYLVTDKVVEVLAPKKMPSWNKYLTSETTIFDPSKVSKSITEMYNHHIFMFLSPSEHAQMLTASTFASVPEKKSPPAPPAIPEF